MSNIATFPPIAAKYAAVGGAGRIGVPVTDILNQPGGRSCDLSGGGSIYWSPATGAQLVHGAIKGRWLQLGGPDSALGYPTTDETAAAGGGFFNDFHNDATIAWTQANGARVVQGLIRAKWRQLGGPGGPVGYPSSDEGPAPGGGRISEFGAGGSITWSATAGAHLVVGAIRDTWLASGGAARLGLPTTDTTMRDDGGVEQTFENALITWTRAAGTTIGPLPSFAAELATVLGQALCDALTAAYGHAVGAGGLVFLPYGIPVADDIVQSGQVNPTQLQTWLAANFDAPFVVSFDKAVVVERDNTHGALSRIYGTAVSFAQPCDASGDAESQRIAAEIVAARGSYGANEQPHGIACEPDDWPLATPAQSYWTPFDFAPSATPAATAAPVPAQVSGGAPTAGTAGAPAAEVQPASWRLRMIPQPMRAGAPPASPAPVQAASTVAAMNAVHLMAASAPVAALAASPVPSPLASPVPGAAISVHLEHTCITLSYADAGQAWWDGVFLADPGWCVAGMARGALLPAAPAPISAVYGVPTALVAVRGLHVSGAFSDDAKRALASGGTSLGPLSIGDATTEVQADGTTCYRRDGVQVVGLFCSTLPVLPPSDPPAPAPAPAEATSTPATSTQTVPVPAK